LTLNHNQLTNAASRKRYRRVQNRIESGEYQSHL